MLAETEGRPAARVARNFEQEDVADPDVAFSETIVTKVMKTGEAVVTANAVEDTRFADTLSVNAIRARSVMALPFRVRGETVGAVYVDNRLQKGAFGEAELSTLTSLCDLAAAAIERARALRGETRPRAISCRTSIVASSSRLRTRSAS